MQELFECDITNCSDTTCQLIKILKCIIGLEWENFLKSDNVEFSSQAQNILFLFKLKIL